MNTMYVRNTKQLVADIINTMQERNNTNAIHNMNKSGGKTRAVGQRTAEAKQKALVKTGPGKTDGVKKGTN